MHYASIFEKYTEWRRNFESLEHVSPNAREYRYAPYNHSPLVVRPGLTAPAPCSLRRENLNQLRRMIKAELESLWQSDQMRSDPIPVTSEVRSRLRALASRGLTGLWPQATRILERYKVIFKAYPVFLKFVKQLAKEAFWLYQGSINANHPTWALAFKANVQVRGEREFPALSWSHIVLSGVHVSQGQAAGDQEDVHTAGQREEEPPCAVPRHHIRHLEGRRPRRQSFRRGLVHEPHPHRAEGADVAVCSRRLCASPQEFVLQQYIAMARELLDKTTPSTSHVICPPELRASVEKDSKMFP